MIENNVKLDIVPLLTRQPSHRTRGGEGRMSEGRPHGFEICIPTRAIHKGMKLGVQRYGMTTSCDSEIRRVGLSVHHDAAESSFIPSSGRKYSCNALQRA